ncbi:protoheme IX farnesyltransferase [Aquincola sp. S2]|uniref:Protoheme IX farnesyltransferase n=1 Tax=Pseudaquabacterium terrae TaxID=2732868 RepID=A0ABX2EI87_9BURK|nr:heme o synthase [Aquabacterium terrae]NRF68324.1 protoheme IX farnesyltransferase [Aquabacterium terrae]
MEQSAELATPSPLPRTRQRRLWHRYVELTKPRVVALMSFTVLVGMLLATSGPVPLPLFLFGTLGVALVAGSAAAINHLVDRRIDALMARTRLRPLPSGALGAVQVLAFAAAIGAAGMALLLHFTNLLCALLTFASLLGYAVVYSLYLKRATPQNIVIGGAAGAAPPLLGWVAVTGQVDPGALVLFLIILVWTPPHFWALAIHRCADYAKADIPMLPVVHGIPFTQKRVLQYTIALLPLTLLPNAIGMSSWLYLAGALPLGLRFIWHAWALKRDVRQAMPTFRFSIVHLFGLFGLLLADHYLLPL